MRLAAEVQNCCHFYVFCLFCFVVFCKNATSFFPALWNNSNVICCATGKREKARKPTSFPCKGIGSYSSTSCEKPGQ